MTAARDTVLITGASSGIGEALALVYAQHQYDLILVARNLRKLESLAIQLSQEYDVDVTVRPCDLSVSAKVKELCETLLAEGRQIDVLVNSAGVVEHGSFAAISADDHQRIVQLNVAGTTAMLAFLIPPMIKRGSGRVLNVASLGAFQALPSVASYAASKAFILSLSEALAEEVRGTGVTVTALCPGMTATNMISGAQQKSPVLQNIPRFVMGDANTVAQKAFHTCRNGNAIVVPGAKNFIASLLSRATPKWLVRRVTGLVGRATLAQR